MNGLLRAAISPELTAMQPVSFTSRLLAIIFAIAGTYCISSEAAVQIIDLRPHYNFSLTNSLIGNGSLNGPNNLSALPAGTNVFAATPFDVEGIAQLTSAQAVLSGRKFPEKIDGIKVGVPCSKLHILHGAGWTEVENTTVGSLIIHYPSGEKREIPIIYGKHVWDWWDNEEKDPAAADTNTVLAWTGVNRISKMFGTNLRIYKTTFHNPKPDAIIQTIDFVSANKQSAPFLLGLSVE